MHRRVGLSQKEKKKKIKTSDKYEQWFWTHIYLTFLIYISNELKRAALSSLIRIFDQIVHLTISAHIAHTLKLHAEMHVFVAL